MSIIDNFEKMLAQGQDNAMLRYTLGNAYFNEQQYPSAITHLRKALEHDPEYSVAWKILGKALVANGEENEAIEVYRKGLEVAAKKGDKQAEKEMQVFLKRLLK